MLLDSTLSLASNFLCGAETTESCDTLKAEVLKLLQSLRTEVLAGLGKGSNAIVGVMCGFFNMPHSAPASWGACAKDSLQGSWHLQTAEKSKKKKNSPFCCKKTLHLILQIKWLPLFFPHPLSGQRQGFSGLDFTMSQFENLCLKRLTNTFIAVISFPGLKPTS